MDRETALLLARAGHSAPSADNSQPNCFVWRGDSLQISYDAPRVAGRTFVPDSPATLLSVGATLENLAQINQHYELGMRVDLTAASQPAGSPYATVTVARSPAEAAPGQVLPLFGRHTNRFPYQKKQSVPEEAKNAICALREDQTRLQLFDKREQVAVIARLAQRAAEIRFQSRDVHEMLAHSLRYTSSQIDSGDGMDVHTLHLPPGGSAFMRLTSSWGRMQLLNKLGAYKFMARVDSELLAQAPMIVAVTGATGPHGAINAGKFLCRTWTKLNEQGLAVHPYYVVADQMARLGEGLIPGALIPQAQDCQSEAKSLFALGGDATLYMLLRVGFATREAPRSRRLPLERVFMDVTGQPLPV